MTNPDTTLQKHSGDGAGNASDATPEALTSPSALTTGGGSTSALLTLDEMVHRADAVQQVMNKLLHDGEHYGTIPGTGKPTLYKAGAEKLNTLFRFSPQYDVRREDFEPTEERPGGHREYTVHCTLVHIPTGAVWGEGVGSCSTLESKYRYRTAKLSCPKCGEETVIKGKKEYGGGWLCWKKNGGCGAKWNDGAEAIEGQERGKVEHPDVADVYNTVLKMAKKRAHVDAVLTCTAASDIFTQDVEDLVETAASETSHEDKGGSSPGSAEVSGKARQRPSGRGGASSSEMSAKYEKLLGDIRDRLANQTDVEAFEAFAEQVIGHVANWADAPREHAEQLVERARKKRSTDQAAAAIESGDTAIKKGTITSAQLQRFHTIASKEEWTDAAKKRMLEAEYGYTSSKEIERAAYEEVCDALSDGRLYAKYARDGDLAREPDDELPF